MNKHKQAARNQGFDLPLDESPVDIPDGWYDGTVYQTGGYIMVRQWKTWDGQTNEYSGRDTEYVVAYGENAGVSLQKYTWSDQYDAYTFKESLIDWSVSENTDTGKAIVARELMEEFDRDD